MTGTMFTHTPTATRHNSSSSSSSSGSSMNERRSSSIGASFKSLGNKLAQHNREVVAAYETYYGSISRPTNAYTPRKSEESQRTLVSEDPEQAQQQSKKSQNAWQKLKQHAKEHHESVNDAYRTFYGIAK